MSTTKRTQPVLRSKRTGKRLSGIKDPVIFDSPPTTWRQLQSRVCQAFEEMGCQSVENRKVRSARGHVTVDVLVDDSGVAPPKRYFCECKYWKRRVPQNQIHAFRTVVADCGAQSGFIISRNGFQRGAKRATAHTNVVLLTWDEFIKKFTARWFAAMCSRVEKRRSRLLELMRRAFWRFGPQRPHAWGRWLGNRQEEQWLLSVASLARTDQWELLSLLFPPGGGLDGFGSAREYFDYVVPHLDRAIERWERRLA